MKHLPSPFALACALAPFLAAQEQIERTAPSLPDPRQEQHAALTSLCGDWAVAIDVAEMPGVPGMEQETRVTGSEHTEAILGGLWIRSTIRSTWQGAPFEGVWLAGYDPLQQHYVSYWISSDASDCGLSTMTGSYDDAKKTWSWHGDSPRGPQRSCCIQDGQDRSVETCWLTGKDGKETQTMRIVRTRSKEPIAIAANDGAVPALDADHRLLQRNVGSWEATVTCQGPGMPKSPEPATEIVIALCNGRWLWSEFHGQRMGVPFTGHSLLGYDPQRQQYIGLWIDSGSAAASVIHGTFDEQTETCTFAGSCVDPAGKPRTITKTLTWKGADERVQQVQFEIGGAKSTMQIDYRRRAEQH